MRVAQVRADAQRLAEARLAERERIARELHDTLLQGFQGLMFRPQAVRQLLPERAGDAQNILDSAMQAGDHAIGEGRDAVQNLRRVRDDGVGVDSQILSQGRRPGHWGLPGMRERSEPFGGSFRVWSKENTGTEIELRIPAKFAYVRGTRSLTRRLGGLFSRFR